MTNLSKTWADVPVTVLGLSRSGVAVARYLSQRGAQCFLSETLPATSNNHALRQELSAMGVEVEMGGHTAKCFSHSDLVVLSPGIPPSASIIKQLTLSQKELISEVELAFRQVLLSPESLETQMPWVGVTGTNGKTTTVSLISAILTEAGYRAPACGNIGTPVISLIDEKPDYMVVELSSFQLEFSPLLQPKISVMTNFKPDHLDWHGSESAYQQAKFEMFNGQLPGGWAVLNANDAVCRQWADELSMPVLWYSAYPEVFETFRPERYLTMDGDKNIQLVQPGQAPERLFSRTVSPLVGLHNVDNILASVASGYLLGVSPSVMKEAVSHFKGVEHRLEPVVKWHHLTFYNDSKATNPDASVSALKAFDPQRLVLIAGGRDKGTDLTEWTQIIQQQAAHVVLMGEAAPRLTEALHEIGYKALSQADSLESAIEQAANIAFNVTEHPMAVLFSPACSSFDHYNNFEARGHAFKAAVQQFTMSAPSPSLVGS